MTYLRPPNFRKSETGNRRFSTYQNAATLEVGQQFLDAFIDAHLRGIDDNFRIFRRLVGRIDAGEVADDAGPGLGVQPLGVSRFAHVQRGVDVDLDELAVFHQLAHHRAVGAKRRDERGQHHQAGVGHQACNLADASNVFDPIVVAEAQIPVQPVAHVVAVQQVAVVASLEKRLFKRVGYSRFAGAGESGEPEHGRFLRLLLGARALIDGLRMPSDVAGLIGQLVGHGAYDHAGADGQVADPVEQDEGAGGGIGIVGVERQRTTGADAAVSNFVEFQLLGRMVLQRVDVDTVVNGLGRGRDFAGSQLQVVLPSGKQRAIVHPDHAGVEQLRDARQPVGVHQHVAAADIDLVGQRQRDGLSGPGASHGAAILYDLGHLATATGRQCDNFIAGRNAAADQRAAKASKIRSCAIDVLDREAHSAIQVVLVHRRAFQQVEHGRTLVPIHFAGFSGHIGTVDRAYRHAAETLDAQLIGERLVVGPDAFENLLVVVD